MRETVRSLRAYFIFLGLVSFAQVAATLSDATGPAIVADVVGVLFALAYLVAGVRLPYLLERHTSWLIGLVWVSVGFHMLALPLEGIRMVSLVHVGIVVAIGLYLSRSVRRLAAEMAAAKRPAA